MKAWKLEQEIDTYRRLLEGGDNQHAWNPVLPPDPSAPPLLLPAHLTALPFLPLHSLSSQKPSAKTMLPEKVRFLRVPGHPELPGPPSALLTSFLSPTVFTLPPSRLPLAGWLTQSILKERAWSKLLPWPESKP